MGHLLFAQAVYYITQELSWELELVFHCDLQLGTLQISAVLCQVVILDIL